jgi:sulfonate transport system substrate-binding protein
MKKKNFLNLKIFVLIVVMPVIIFVSCGESKQKKTDAAAAAGGEADTNGLVVRSSHFTGPAYDTQFYLARQKGFWEDEFAKDNITLEIYEILTGGGPVANEAMIAGAIDIIHAIGDQPMITGIVAGTNAKALATLSRQTSTQGIYVAADSPIKTVEDLRGKAVAVAVGTFTHKCVIGVLEDYGIREEDIDLVNLPSINEDMAALESGDIVGFAGNFSATYTYIQEGRLRQLVDFENHPAYTFLVVNNGFINKYPEVTQRILNVVVRTQKWANENPEEAARLVADYTGQDYEAVLELRRQVDFNPDITDADVAQFKFTYDFLDKHDFISKRLDDLSVLYDDTFIKKALQETGL